MRITISLSNALGRRALRHARRAGVSLSALVTGALSRLRGEPAAHPRAATPFRLIVVGGSGPARRLDLDRTSELLVAEDELRCRHPLAPA